MSTIHNPICNDWHADPEARYYNGKYYIYVTQSFSDFDRQTNIDLLVSDDLIKWEKKSNIINMEDFPWAVSAIWAPTVTEKNGKYYMIFASNDIHEDNEGGGLEIAVSDSPEGPFRGFLKHQLIGSIINGAQPIDAHLFKDDNGKMYLYYGGWGHCNAAVMNEDMTGFVPFENGELFKEITPEEYVEGPCMLKKDGLYYFMWSTGNWKNSSYGVRYGVSASPVGPFEKMGTILSSDPHIANGPGHNGYLRLKNSGKYLIVYHRRPLDASEDGCRVICIDRLDIGNKKIQPVCMTNELEINSGLL